MRCTPKKLQALNLLKLAIELNGVSDIAYELSSDGETVILIADNGAKKLIDIAGDNIPAMLKDILNRANDWFN